MMILKKNRALRMTWRSVIVACVCLLLLFITGCAQKQKPVKFKKAIPFSVLLRIDDWKIVQNKILDNVWATSVDLDVPGGRDTFCSDLWLTSILVSVPGSIFFFCIVWHEEAAAPIRININTKKVFRYKQVIIFSVFI